MFMIQEKVDLNKNSKVNRKGMYSLSKILQINKNETRNEQIEETKRRNNRKDKKIRRTKTLSRKTQISQYNEKKQRKI